MKMLDLYTENHKTCLKEIREDLNKWRYIPCSWVGRLNIVNMTIFPKLIYKFNKIPINFFIEIDKLILKFLWKFKETRRAKATLRKNKHAELSLIDIDICKATVIKTTQ